VPVFWDLPKPKGLLYEEEGASYRRPHLNGEKPAFNLQGYMDDGRDNVAFVIIRKFECSGASVMKASSGTALSWTESIYTKSDISKSALQQIATCSFQSAGANPKSIEETDWQRLERERIHPADLFFFHHHHLLKTWSMQNRESKEHTEDLLKYVDTKYRKQFAEAKSLFKRGLVTQAHILKLFKPNEPVVSEVSGRPVAYILQYWPSLGSNGSTNLSCWSFQFDGTRFARKNRNISIPPLDSETNIQTLDAYPIRFADSELRERLRDRGKKQWQYRTMAQVTYKGWNVGKDLYFVSNLYISSSILIVGSCSPMRDLL
jgi:hypothetical protein